MPEWKNYSTAPDEGWFVADVKDISSKPLALNIKSNNGIFPIIIMQRGSRILAFVNACPHQYLPLDYRSSNILSSDGNRLLCSAHGAMFDCETGEGITGEVLGCSLDQVPLMVSDTGKITIGSET